MTPLRALVACLVAATAGCCTHPWQPVDLEAPAWTVHHSDIVWKPSRNSPEIAGELILANRTDGARFAQFSKGGLPLITTRREGAWWRMESTRRPRPWCGRGSPPSRVPWFFLDQLPPAGDLPHGWVLTSSTPGTWRLVHPRSGGAIEGPSE